MIASGFMDSTHAKNRSSISWYFLLCENVKYMSPVRGRNACLFYIT
jgi:hypothetical protein